MSSKKKAKKTRKQEPIEVEEERLEESDLQAQVQTDSNQFGSLPDVSESAETSAVEVPSTSESLVVFAFRLTKAERDEIHAAAGSAKASKFVRGIALAGARGDMKALQEAVDEIHTGVR